MERAAQLRAQGKGWQAVADEIGLTAKTVRQYPSKYPPFEVDAPDQQGLVGWYREQLWSEEVDRLVREAQPSALEALVDVVEHDGVGTDRGPTWGNVVQAARSALKATGFEEAQKTKRKLETQEDITGGHGEPINVNSGPDLSKFTDEELEQYKRLMRKAADAEASEESDA